MDLAGGHVLCLEQIDREDIFSNLGKTGSGFGGSGGKYRAFNVRLPPSLPCQGPLAKHHPTALQLGKGKGMSVLNMIDAMKKASGFDYKFDIVGRRTGDVPDLTADPALAEKELGFKAKRDLEEMCRDQWNWQSKNPQGYAGQA